MPEERTKRPARYALLVEAVSGRFVEAGGEAPWEVSEAAWYAQDRPAASRIRSATSRGRDSSDTWLAASSMVFAPIRFAMNR